MLAGLSLGLLIAAQGFGGVGEDPDALAARHVQLDGAAVQAEAPDDKAGPPQTRATAGHPVREERTRLTGVVRHRDLRGPVGRALSGLTPIELKPLQVLRQQMSDFEAARRKEQGYTAVVIDGVTDPERLESIYVAKRKLLDEVEIWGLRQRQGCMLARGHADELPEVLLPIGMRLRITDPTVQAHLSVPDPDACRRIDLVADASIARI